MDIEKTLYESAVALAEKRYPSGWGGAATLYLHIQFVLLEKMKNQNL